MDENISRAAGASHGQMMDAERLRGHRGPARAHAGPADHPVRPGRPTPAASRPCSPAPTEMARRRARQADRRGGRTPAVRARPTGPSTRRWSTPWSPDARSGPAAPLPLDARHRGRRWPTRGHRGDRPQGGRLGAGRDGRGLPGVPALPRPAEGDHLRVGPHPARPSRLPAAPGSWPPPWPTPTGWWSPGPARASWPPAWRGPAGTSRSG